MKLRIALVAALVGGSLFVGVAPASATCRPEKPSTCEIEDPLDPQCVVYYTTPVGVSGSINYCEPPIALGP